MHTEIDLCHAREALFAIDPGCPRDHWHRIGRAAIAAGLTVDDVDEWSSSASNYAGTRDVRAAFRGITSEGGTGPGTLWRAAMDAGWKPLQGNGEQRQQPKPTRPTKARPRPTTGRRVAPAAEVWSRFVPATEVHGYIAAKQGMPEGLRVVPEGDPLTVAGLPVAGCLVVPVLHDDGTPLSLQFIAPPDMAACWKAAGRPGKLNLPGASMGDAGRFVVGAMEPGAVVFLVEGIGQAWACWKASGHAAVVCFGWGRVQKVAQALRQQNPAALLALVPDAGKEDEAVRIAAELGAAVVKMPKGSPANFDANDYALAHGFDALEVLLSKSQEPAASDAGGVVLVSGADLTPEPVRWLWPGWLALGKLHILAGAPGQGKTTIALTLAATVTTGGRWPDGTRCPLGNVLVWSGEDDPADTLLPRLLAAGADRSRVFFVTGARIGGRVEPFDPARDMAALQAQAARIGDVRLIIVDPVVSAVTGDSHKNTEVRRALQPLVDMAATMGAALLGITHFSKGGQGQDPASRVVGSIAFTAVARVVLVAAKAKGEDGEDRRILARSKSNLGPDEGGFAYSLEQCEPLPGIHASRVTWGEAVEGTARELLAESDNTSELRCTSDDAAAALVRILGPDMVPMQAAVDAMKREGFTEKVIRKARERLSVIVKRNGFGKEMRSYWKLPPGLALPTDNDEAGAHSCPPSAIPAQTCSPSNVGMNGHEGAEHQKLDGFGSRADAQPS